jgi:excisionase family DNA binding protein
MRKLYHRSGIQGNLQRTGGAVTKYLKVPEAATMLGISEKAAWQRLYRGELPHRRWGRRVLIPMDELEKFLAALPGTTAEEAVATLEGSSPP